MEKLRRVFIGVLAGYGIYLAVAWGYIEILNKMTGGEPDTFPPFVWPLESPFLILPDSWHGPPLDENLLSLLGGLLLIGGGVWGYLNFPPRKAGTKTTKN
jgi:hypothetical protein